MKSQRPLFPTHSKVDQNQLPHYRSHSIILRPYSYKKGVQAPPATEGREHDRRVTGGSASFRPLIE